MERTYIMLKPDAIKRGLIGEIVGRIEKKGYKILDMKFMQLRPEVLREHYAHVADMDFYPAMEKYMMSGPVLAMVVEGENVIKGTRILIGATKFEEGQAGTIRGDYAMSTTQNLIHGSDSVENAEIEIRRFFNN